MNKSFEAQEMNADDVDEGSPQEILDRANENRRISHPGNTDKGLFYPSIDKKSRVIAE